jgi:tetratricopeptide (TPR) repeat protein
MGAGLRWKEYSLDYAYVPFGDFGVSHRVSLGYEFPEPKKETPQAPVTIIQQIPVPAPTPAPQAAPGAPAPSGPSVQIKFKVPVEPGEPGVEVLPKSKLEGEIQDAMALVKADPQNTRNWYQLGNLYFQAKQKESAVQCFEQVLRLEPNHPELRDWLEKYKNTP